MTRAPGRTPARESPLVFAHAIESKIQLTTVPTLYERLSEWIDEWDERIVFANAAAGLARRASHEDNPRMSV